MDNPYTPPSVRTPENSRFMGSPIAKRISIGISVVAIVAFAFVAWILISQAIRLGSVTPNLPKRLAGFSGHEAVMQSSWVGGVTATFGIVLNCLAIAMSRRGRTGYSAMLIAFSVFAMAVVAVLFKPN